MLDRLGLLAEPSPTQSETLDGIGRAFYAALDVGWDVIVVTLVAVAVGAAFFVRWMLRERRRERAEIDELEARHEAAMSADPSPSELRDWVRVPAHLPLTVLQPTDGPRLAREECETENVSAGGVAFHCTTPPPVGRAIDLSLDVGEPRPLALRGVVVRVAPPTTDASALVAVRLGPITPAEREHIAHWVALEEARQIAIAHADRVCVVCRKPLDGIASDVHTSCAAARPNPRGRNVKAA